MNRYHTIILHLIAVVPLIVGAAPAEWAPVAPGITYTEMTLPGPARVFVCRADRGVSGWTIDTAIGQGRIRDGLEVVSSMARRYDGSTTFDGRRYEVKAAVNGDYFSTKTEQPPGGQITGGWFVRRFMDHGGGSGFVWTQQRRAFLGGNVVNRKKLQRVIFPGGEQLDINGLNVPREPNQLVLYTPHYAENTGTDDDGVEVVLDVDEPLSITPKDAPAKVRVLAIHDGAGSTPLAFDQSVLSGHGKAAAALREHAREGGTMRIRLAVYDYGVPDLLAPADWSNAYASLGGHFFCVVDGRVRASRYDDNLGATKRHPRTAVAFNDSHVFFIVVDGRSDKSIGMTIGELGDFCAERLQATHAIAQDGGGSSTMWVDGEVKNEPSDGQERPVANGYLLVLVHKPQRSERFEAGRSLTVRDVIELRLGPGTQYGVSKELDAGTTITVEGHRLNGIRAKGEHWWKCSTGGAEGWVSEDAVFAPANAR